MEKTKLSTYEMVLLAAKRAKDLHDKSDHPLSDAIKEIEDNKIFIKSN